MSMLRSPQYWLAELDQYDNPTLIDGSHGAIAGVNQAAYLLEALGYRNGRRFAVARVELSKCKPSAKGVNHRAIQLMNEASKEKAE